MELNAKYCVKLSDEKATKKTQKYFKTKKKNHKKKT